MKPQELLHDKRFPLHWQMNLSEKLAMVGILERIRPRLSLEIGTYKGGSLQVLSEYSERVISVDINSWVSEELKGHFDNVLFKTGNSMEVLPELVQEMNKEGISPGFVLVDGAHTTDGVREDLSILLQIRPTDLMVILMHDSFNPRCREGIIHAPWEQCPYVHSVEIDFVSGGFVQEAFDTAAAGSMWSGFACAVLMPEEREHPLEVLQSQKSVFEAVKRISVYANEGKETPVPASEKLYRRARSAIGRFRRALVRREEL